MSADTTSPDRGPTAPDASPSGGDDDSSGPPVTECRFRARSYELDSFDHVNHAVFLNWLEHGRFDALAQGGVGADDLAADGWAVVVARLEIDYRAEVRMGDEVIVRTRVDEARNTSMTLAQRIFRIRPVGVAGGTGASSEARERDGRPDGEEVLAAEARVVAVWLREGRPRRIPDRVLRALTGR